MRRNGHPEFLSRPNIGRGVAMALMGTLLTGLVIFTLAGLEDAGAQSNAAGERLRADGSDPDNRPRQTITFEDGCLTSACHVSLTQPTFMHATVSMVACNVCHGPDAGNHTYPIRKNVDALCRTCHDTGEAVQFPHVSGQDDSCLACHAPHSSDVRALLAGDGVDDACADCHLPATGAFAHSSYRTGDCAACHLPHGGDDASLLRGGAGAAHCRTCHASLTDSMGTDRFSHAMVDRSCLACHEHHAADESTLLTMAPGDLCLSCHEEISDRIRSSTVSHDPVLTGDHCLSCHDAHSSSHSGMLLNKQSEVCLSCHDNPVEARDGRTVASMSDLLGDHVVQHGAIRIADCSACHTVHGGTHQRLLRSLNPALPLGPYDKQNYALCFSCHDDRLAEDANATQFRHGKQNLHRVHLQTGDRSRGCSTCHAVHSTTLPRLIVEEVNFEGSGWAMPMQFELTAGGGRCGPVCHEPLEYRRHDEQLFDQDKGDGR